MLKKAYIIIVIIIQCILVGANVYASEKPDIGDVLQETGPAIQVDKDKSDVPAIKEEPVKEPLKSLNGRKVFVKKIRITGNSVISSGKLEKLLNIDEFVNKKLSLNDMNKAAAVITRYYRDKGYFVARAYVPKQEMKNSTLTIAVIEGNYGKFEFSNNSLVRGSIVQGMLDVIKGKNISVNTIERSMLIINDTPGVRVIRADVMPGGKVGTSDFAIATGAGNHYSGYIVADNYGGKYTGKKRLSTALNINSPFKVGDKLSLRGMITDKSWIENYRIAYSLPLSYSGLRGEIVYADTDYELGGKYSDLEAVGNSRNFEFNFTYPVIRTRLTNLKAFLKFSRQDMTDEIRIIDDQTKKKINSINTGLTYTNNRRVNDWNSQSIIDFDYTSGKLKFKDPVDKETDEAGADTNGHYFKINLSLRESLKFNARGSLNSSLECQYALNNKNLDGSEDFSIGGHNGVRLYPSGELSAENGYLLKLELFYNLPEYKGISSRVSIFYDRGSADMADNTVGFETRTLQDIGLGYYFKYKKIFANIHWAFKIDGEDIQSEADYDNKLLFQTGFVF